MNARTSGRLDGQTLHIGVDALLARLERVQKTGNGWRANCPVGHKTRGTLSIARGDDGRVLLHCFSGCGVSDVLGGLGLTLTDIQPARLRDESTEGRRAARERFRLASVSAAAGVLARESDLVMIAAHDLLQGRALAGDDVQRLGEAAERIAQAREALA